ncbi:hypothetical protein NRK68_36575 (plasmid) [Streptomyces yangpuensis]|uniref:Uncharacterized protein n=1 Tax=Streptomyces yangpuensis TaxID=1648182 RepID=A0ABY5QAY8_9ACTN|nr:hypothetical protein [Streptomyces yangpuensis]UUY52773.1 hypothetical protein NRK68_36575 [Streptomyces yangpuensis]
MNDFAGVVGVILLLLIMLSNLTRTGRKKRYRKRTSVRGHVRLRKSQEPQRGNHADIWWARAAELRAEGDFAGAERAMKEALASDARAAARRAGLSAALPDKAGEVVVAPAAAEAADRRARKEVRETERRVALALLFVPPGQRERYRQEWVNEVAQLSPHEAAVFALHLLLSAPKMGMLLALNRIFGRKAA